MKWLQQKQKESEDQEDFTLPEIAQDVSSPAKDDTRAPDDTAQDLSSPAEHETAQDLSSPSECEEPPTSSPIQESEGMEITTPDATTPCCSYSILEIQAPSVDMLSLRRISLPVGWIDHSSESDQCVRLCKLKNQPLESNQPVVVELCLVLNRDGSWSVYAHNYCLGSSSCKLLENIPDRMTPEYLPSVVKLLDGCNIV